jgi:N,N'-diacetyllegionaminate synthase
MFKIGNKKIDEHSPTYIIAEVGVNHNGDMKLAKEMIDRASEIGANAVKFQTFKAEKLVTKGARKAEYQVKNTGTNSESQFEMLKKLELSFGDFIELKHYCEEKGIEFLSTPFDLESAEFLREIGVHAFKIGSGDLTNIPLLKKISEMNIPVILSTGMANLSEVEEAVEVFDNQSLAILHCTSVYPAPYDEVNLKAILTLKHAFNTLVGYSDHTLGNEISIAAVAMGAKIIEKHFTLDKNLPGPDHKASLDVEEFTHFVQAIRNVEKSFGNGIKKCSHSEQDTKIVARKSIVATQKIKAGEKILPEYITVKRPGDGIPPKYIERLIGRVVKNDIEEDQVIKWDDLL